MKEATGELNMTVVTLIAIAAIAGLFYFAIWPMVQQMLVQQTCNTYGPDYKAVQDKTTDSKTQGQATINRWCCCTDNQQSCSDATKCIIVKDDTETTTTETQQP
jgi:hypothetical protein